MHAHGEVVELGIVPFDQRLLSLQIDSKGFVDLQDHMRLVSFLNSNSGLKGFVQWEKAGSWLLDAPLHILFLEVFQP